MTKGGDSGHPCVDLAKVRYAYNNIIVVQLPFHMWHTAKDPKSLETPKTVFRCTIRCQGFKFSLCHEALPSDVLVINKVRGKKVACVQLHQSAFSRLDKIADYFGWISETSEDSCLVLSLWTLVRQNTIPGTIWWNWVTHLVAVRKVRESWWGRRRERGRNGERESRDKVHTSRACILWSTSSK